MSIERMFKTAAAQRDILMGALKEIRDAEQIDVLLDPTWSQRIAAEAIEKSRKLHGNVFKKATPSPAKESDREC